MSHPTGFMFLMPRHATEPVKDLFLLHPLNNPISLIMHSNYTVLLSRCQCFSWLIRTPGETARRPVELQDWS